MTGTGSARPLVALVLAALVLIGWPASPARADDVSAAEAAERARAAMDGDPAAVETLRATTSVDGRPVDLDAALGPVGTPDADHLAELADMWSSAPSTPGGPTDPAAASAAATADRARAAEVLDDERFQEPDLPRPFRGPLRWIGEQAAALWDRAIDLLAPVFGTRGAAVVLAAVLVGGLIGLLTAVVARRARSGTPTGAPLGHFLVDPTLDPDDLDARADDAAASGRYADAVRARYEAGLLRLVAAGRLDLRPDTTASDAAAQVDEPAMDDLTAAFEEIVYGGRTATEADDRASRQGWADLANTRSRRGRRVEVRR